MFHFGYHGIDRKRWGTSLIANLIQTIGSSAPMTIIWDFLHISFFVFPSELISTSRFSPPRHADSEK